MTTEREGSLTDVEGLKVGHYTDNRRPTGCTVILCEQGAVAAVDVRGSAPGTRETDLLDPLNQVEKAHAILLSGGSAFGLDAAAGVMRYLEERDIGYVTPYAKVPIVPAAILYDLRLGDPTIRPDADSGYKACVNATDGPVTEGSTGAGAGATIGKLQPGVPMKGGIGTASLRLDGGVVIAALVAVNCVGNVVDPSTGHIIAGSRLPDRPGFVSAVDWARSGVVTESGNTTIGVIATNVVFKKTALKKIAQMGHDGMARVINPVHTPWDGDTLFALSTGTNTATIDVGRAGTLAAEIVSTAILRAIRMAASFPEYPDYVSWTDMRKANE